MSKVRGFELHIYDDAMNLIDKFSLDLVTSPSGLGFTQDVTVITTTTVDYIVNRALKKQDVKLTVEFEEPNSYIKVNNLRDWIANNIEKKLVLYYNDTVRERLMDVYVKSFPVSEIVSQYNSIPLTLTPLSPFYLRGIQKTTVSLTGVGKEYPFTYPYSYGGTQLVNNVLNNSFFESIPLYVKILGKVTHPIIILKDENGENYAEVSFPDLIIEEGQYLTVDAINSRILFFDGVNTYDYYNELDKTKNSFLKAKAGKTIIDANFLQTDTGYIEIIYIQYTM